MKKKVFLFGISMILIAVIAIVFSLTGCTGNGGGGEETAEELCERAIQAMKNGDWESAYDLFNQGLYT